MHNSHYIILKSTDVETAKLDVENILDDWVHSENNWYSVRKVIDLDNLYVDDIVYINTELELFNKVVSIDKFTKLQSENIDLLNKASINDRHYYWLLSDNYTTLYHMTPHVKLNKTYTINDLKTIDDYFGYNYDEYGITNLYDGEKNDDEHVFFVEIDMHS